MNPQDDPGYHVARCRQCDLEMPFMSDLRRTEWMQGHAEGPIRGHDEFNIWRSAGFGAPRTNEQVVKIIPLAPLSRPPLQGDPTDEA